MCSPGVVTIDTDWGVGLIHRRGNCVSSEQTFGKELELKLPGGLDSVDYDFFDAHRPWLLNLVNVKDFCRAHATGYQNVRSVGWPSKCLSAVAEPLFPVHTFFIAQEGRGDSGERMQMMAERHEISNCTCVQAATPERSILAGCSLSAQQMALTAAHVECWQRIAQLDSGEIGLVLEDGIVFHKQWKHHLWKCLLECDWELFMLDCWYLDGWETSQDVPPPCQPTQHQALRCVLAGAYMLTPAAARWLLNRHNRSWDHESDLLDLQARGHAYSSMPKLALQLWRDEPNHVQSATMSTTRECDIAKFYLNTYHHMWPYEFYDYDYSKETF